jgi:hypothetical protein
MPKVTTKTQPTALIEHPTPTGRIIALDLLRGYFILVIASIHLAYTPSFLSAFDGRGQLWFSEAEGFFFISGLLIGIIRHKDIIRFGLKVATKKTLRRSLKLYAASVVLTLGFVVLARTLISYNIGGVKAGVDTTSSWLHLITQTLTLQYSYGWTDFLIYYASFLFVAPLALWLLRKKLWWVVLLISGALWYWHWTNFGIPHILNSFLLWQMSFFLGVVIGYHWDQIIAYTKTLSWSLRRRIGNLLIASMAIMYLVSYILILGAEHIEKFPQQVPGWGHGLANLLIGMDDDHGYNRLLVDGRGGLLRPLVLLLMMAGLFVLVRRYEAEIVKAAGWLLIPFGQNSLYVYILQGILIFLVPLFITHGSFALNTLIEIAVTIIVWFAIRHKFLFKIIPR